MSLQSILSSDQILISGFIVSIFSAIIFSIDGVTAAVLFLCGVLIGATLTEDFLRRYSSTETSNSGDEENPQAKSVPNWNEIDEVLLSPRLAKYLFFFILISTILTGGLWGAGQVSVGPLAPSYEISGQVVDKGEPVEGVNVTIEDSTGERVIESLPREAEGFGNCVQQYQRPPRRSFSRRVLECRGYGNSTAV